ncbi:universal stress protein [Streptomyces griseorubiginosus]|uniref:universal stress protein n=1 Tax=Streptomyces griseorubiginosus TaxID=67304 RepID=UPI002814BA17|nr:universal stress protein [Streptomyces griseorubiginosus]
MCRTVAVGLDGSPESLAAAEWAADEAWARAIPLRLVHAGDQPLHDYAPFAGDPVAAPGTDRADQMVREVAAVLAHRRPGLRLRWARLDGSPAAALTDAAREAALLVLGSRGPGRTAGYLLGSVASAVLARAERPVVLVRDATGLLGHGGDPPAARHAPWRGLWPRSERQPGRNRPGLRL